MMDMMLFYIIKRKYAFSRGWGKCPLTIPASCTPIVIPRPICGIPIIKHSLINHIGLYRLYAETGKYSYLRVVQDITRSVLCNFYTFHLVKLRRVAFKVKAWFHASQYCSSKNSIFSSQHFTIIFAFHINI